MIFVDNPCPRTGRARAFTDGSQADLTHALRSAGCPDAQYAPPVLAGARVVAGGYYKVTTRQRAALLRRGALAVNGIVPDLTLEGMLVVAVAATKGKK